MPANAMASHSAEQKPRSPKELFDGSFGLTHVHDQFGVMATGSVAGFGVSFSSRAASST